jgi:molecular chaperone DnaK (HSP70)
MRILQRVAFVVCVLSWTAIVFANAFHVMVHHRHHQRRSGMHSRRSIALMSQLVGDHDDDDDTGIGVGIDLGTTNSAIAYLDANNEPQIIPIPNNGRTVPSVVAYWNKEDDDTDCSKALVGKEAIQWEQENQGSAYRHVKRIMGMSAAFLLADTKEVVPHLVLASGNDSEDKERKNGKRTKKKNKPPSLEKLIQAAKEDPAMLQSLSPLDAKHSQSPSLVSPESISTCILHKLLITAREHTSRKINRAVIGVPAYFNDAQRDATIRAANAAGIHQVKLLREPEAAALAYGVDKDADEQEELVLVFDLGGGTYDVSILLVEKGLTEIVCTAGNAQLGGTNFDAKIAKHVTQQSYLGKNPPEDVMDVILRSAESIRIYLSNNKVVDLSLPSTDDGWRNLVDPKSVILPRGTDLLSEEGNNNSTHVSMQLTRREMEKLCAAEFQALLRPIREVAIMAGALLPGDARPGAAETAFEMEAAFTDAEKFYDDDVESDNGIPEVVHGALQAAEAQLNLKSAKKLQQKGRKKAREVAKQERKYRAESRKVQEAEKVKVRADGISGRPLSRIVLVGGATRMPAIGRMLSSLTGVVPQPTVDPDEAVALGCAVHVGVLDGKEELGVVLSPMQAALLRAAVEMERREGQLDGPFEDEFDDDEEFSEIQYL